MTDKICVYCKEPKPLSAFHKEASRKDGYRNGCVECFRKQARERYVKDQKSNPDIMRHKRYGILPYQWQCLLAEQNNECAICKRQFSEEVMPVLDHCHSTLNIRGALCSLCNVLLGSARDDTTILRNAIEYLEKDV